jgi:hypothetical protein
MIDSQEQAGGWPELASLPALADTDNDGMPDAWEEAHGLDKIDPIDNIKYTIITAYTNVEVYINGIVKN